MVAVEVLQRMQLQAGLQNVTDQSALVTLHEPRPGEVVAIGTTVTLFTGPVTSEMSIKLTTRGIIQTLPSPAATAQPASPARYGDFRVMVEPEQKPVSRYFVQVKKFRAYPAWYPKKFLPKETPSKSVSSSYNTQSVIPPQTQLPCCPSSVNPYINAVPTQPIATQEGVSYAFGGTGYPPAGTQEIKLLGTQQPSISLSIPVPNVMRLPKDDAMIAIQKAGLIVRNITLTPSGESPSGLVISQSPRASEIVTAGTMVDLTIAQ